MHEGIDHALATQPPAIAEAARWFRGAPTSLRYRVGVKNRVTVVGRTVPLLCAIGIVALRSKRSRQLHGQRA